MDVRAELHQMIDDVLGDDPRRALIAYRRLATEHLDWLEYRVVHVSRREGWSWARIGRLLGRSRQSVHRKFRSPGPALPPSAPREEIDALRRQRRLQHIWAGRRRADELDRLEPDDVVPW